MLTRIHTLTNLCFEVHTLFKRDFNTAHFHFAIYEWRNSVIARNEWKIAQRCICAMQYYYQRAAELLVYLLILFLLFGYFDGHSMLKLNRPKIVVMFFMRYLLNDHTLQFDWTLNSRNFVATLHFAFHSYVHLFTQCFLSISSVCIRQIYKISGLIFTYMHVCTGTHAIHHVWRTYARIFRIFVHVCWIICGLGKMLIWKLHDRKKNPKYNLTGCHCFFFFFVFLHQPNPDITFFVMCFCFALNYTQFKWIAMKVATSFEFKMTK